jgi:transcriptional regulator with XRE-family HTH domain
MRRLRRDKNWSLHQLAGETGISYTHLSRIENDSTVPNAETVSKLASALDGDLKLMLERARCLPQEILERIMASDTATRGGSLLRAARLGGDADHDSEDAQVVARVARDRGVPPDESLNLADAVLALFALPPDRRSSLAALIQSLNEERDEDRR